MACIDGCFSCEARSRSDIKDKGAAWITSEALISCDQGLCCELQVMRLDGRHHFQYENHDNHGIMSHPSHLPLNILHLLRTNQTCPLEDNGKLTKASKKPNSVFSQFLLLTQPLFSSPGSLSVCHTQHFSYLPATPPSANCSCFFSSSSERISKNLL